MSKSRYLLFVAGCLILMASRCDHSHSSFKEVPVTDYFDSCAVASVIDFGDLITMGDPGDRFMISLPYSWDIRESYTDSLYGIFASNFLSIPRPIEERMSLGITGYISDNSLKEYYKNELNTLVNDKDTQVIETGVTLLNNEEAYWVKFNNSYKDQKIFQLVLYAKRQLSMEIYIVQATAYSAEIQNDILCNLKRLMVSLEWVTSSE